MSNTLKCLKIVFIIFILAVVLASCGSDDSDDNGGDGQDSTAPAMSQISPDDSATGVALDTPIFVTFSEACDASTINANSFQLTNNRTPVAGSISTDNNRVTFNPDADLSAETVYTVILTTAITDLAGNHLASDVTSSFTTINQSDDITDCKNCREIYGRGYNTSGIYTITVNNNPLEVYCDMTASGGGWTLIYDQDINVSPGYAPTSDWLAGINTDQPNSGHYSILNLIDELNHDMGQFEFRLEWPDQNISPAYITWTQSMNPLNGRGTVDLTSSEPAVQGGCQNASFAGLGADNGSAALDGNIGGCGWWSIGLSSPFADTVSGDTGIPGFGNGGGRLIASSARLWVRGHEDTTAPSISKVSPADGSVNVPLNSNLRVTFSKPCDASTITTSSFSLSDGNAFVAGEFTIKDNSVIFDPNSVLTANTTYTAKVTTAVTDMSGNHLVSDHTWQLTTTEHSTDGNNSPWQQSYKAGYLDSNNNYMGGTEIHHIVAHKGKLYAGNSFWMDPRNAASGGNEGWDVAWAQVLRLDAPDTQWESDLELGRGHMKVHVLESITLTRDASGTSLPSPLNLLILASSAPTGCATGCFTFAVHDDENGGWIREQVTIDSDVIMPPKNGSDDGWQTRSLAVHRDKVTGIERVYLSLGKPGILSGVYDPTKPTKIRWDEAMEYPESGLLELRPMCMTVANGSLYFSAGDSIYKREDGTSPTYTEVFSLGATSSSTNGGIRGLTTIPDPDGNGESLLYSWSGVKPYDVNGRIRRLDMDAQGNYTENVEVNIKALAADMLFPDGSGQVHYTLGPHSEFHPVTDPDTGETVHIFGLLSTLGTTDSSLFWKDGPHYGGALYGVRRADGTYSVNEINGRYSQEKPVLIVPRSFAASPFGDDMVYGGGHDCAWKNTETDMAWIFKAGLSTALTAPKDPVPAATHMGVEYAVVDGISMKLDLFTPEGIPPFPTIVWFHGGGWKSGSRASIQPGARAQIGRGYAVASVSYTFSTTKIWPQQAYDIKAAIRFLRANADQYHLNKDKFAAWGASAGGHLASIAGTTCGVAELEDLSMGNADESSCVQAAIDWYGPTDFSALPDSFHNTFRGEYMLVGCNRPADGPPCPQTAMDSANPAFYADAGDAPHYIAHGNNDTRVMLSQSQLLSDALTDAGVANTLDIIAGGIHAGPKFNQEENLSPMEDFLDWYLK